MPVSNLATTLLIAFLGLITAIVTAFFAFIGKNRENKLNNWDQLNEALMADRAFWHEEASILRTQLEAKVLEIVRLRVELDATKDALVYRTRHEIEGKESG